MYNVFQGNSNITGYRICCLLPLILSVDLDAEKNMEKILKVISLEGATSPTSLAESTGMTTDEVGEIFCHVVAKYTVCLYGKRQITKWLSNNKGCTYLDMITMSDFAYIASLLKNNFEYWPEQYNIKKMSKDEQKQYKEENQLSPPEVSVQVTYKYRNPDVDPRTEKYIDCVLKMSERSIGGRKEYVSNSFEGKAKAKKTFVG